MVLGLKECFHLGRRRVVIRVLALEFEVYHEQSISNGKPGSPDKNR